MSEEGKNIRILSRDFSTYEFEIDVMETEGKKRNQGRLLLKKCRSSRPSLAAQQVVVARRLDLTGD